MRDRLLRAISPLPVDSVLIYGSVARGTATARSDIDVLVLLASPVDAAVLNQTRSDVAQAQMELGYLPDPDFPVEIFTLARASAAVAAEDPDEDQAEIIRALTDDQVVLVESAALTRLTEAARQRSGERR